MRRAFLAVLACLAPAAARAGNLDELFLDDQAALTGGAVCAVGESGGMAWYNPAGLAALDRPSIQVSASAYSARYYHLPKYVRLVLPDRVTSMGVETEAFSSTPSTLVYASRLAPDLTGALSFFAVQQTDVLATRSETFKGLAFDGVLPYTYEQGLGLDLRFKKYRGGASLGWQALEGFRLGLSVLGEYDRSGFVGSFWGDLRFDDVLVSGLPARLRSRRDFRVGESEYGLKGVAGFQWKAGHFALGGSFASPRFSVYREEDADLYVDLAVNTPAAVVLQVHGLDSKVRHPYVWSGVYRARGGLAFLYGDGSSLAYEVDASDLTDDEGRGNIFNHRLGWLQRLTPAWSFGLGAYTDLGSPEKMDFVISNQTDYYGATAGLRYWKPLGDPQKPLVEMTTVIGVGYKRGSGVIAGPSLDALNYNYFLPPVATSDLVFEEAIAHLGGGLVF